METDKSDRRRSSQLSGFIVLAALLIAAAGGYLYYQNNNSPEVTAGPEQSAAPPQVAQGTPASGESAPGSPADSAAKPRSQPAASNSGAPTGQPFNTGSQPAAQASAPSADDARAVPPGQGQADGRGARTVDDSSPASAGDTPQSERSKSASLPTNDIAYVRKSRANIRSEPNVRGKRVGQVSKGTRLNVVARAGKWVQVEDGNTKGWISASSLAPRLP